MFLLKPRQELKQLICRQYLSRSQHHKRRSSGFCFHPRVTEALKNDEPIVALESTIITHGMPYPVNVNTARSVENIIQKQGAIPATIAVLDGKIHIGLHDEELELLASKLNLVKISRRDLPYVLAKELSGGTTVSATMLIARRAGIPVFVTGGIGGVHRGAETSFDISADLVELGRTPITVISSGVKSILDIGKTLEYLETLGTTVVTYGNSTTFPSFFNSTSDFSAPACVSSAREAANMILKRDQLGLENGILIAVPLPENLQADKNQIDEAIQRALKKAESSGVQGKAVTPFLLGEVNAITKGRSLQSNIALIEHNAIIGAQIAVELKKFTAGCRGEDKNTIETEKSPDRVPVSVMDHTRFTTGRDKEADEANEAKEVVVIGGSIVDLVATVLEDDIKMDASSHRGNIRRSFGGVGRNVADCLTRLGHRPLFISTIGDDTMGRELLGHNNDMVKKGFARIARKSTATYCVILDKNGNFAFGIGDMAVHQDLSIKHVNNYLDEISKAKLVVMDGNAPVSTIEYVLDRCEGANVPVWYETTDVHKAARPFIRQKKLNSLRYVSPNLLELNAILATCGLASVDTRITGEELQEAVTDRCEPLLELVPNVIVTLGQQGVAVISKDECASDGKISSRFYTAPDVNPSRIISVSGAGDCFAGGYISGILHGFTPDQCAKLGTLAARHSLLASPAVPETIIPNLVSSVL